MSDVLGQVNRGASFNTPYGQDVLVLRQLEAAEGLSELFEFRVLALATKKNIKLEDGLGKNCGVTLKTYDGVDRNFNGVLIEAQAIGEDRGRVICRFVMRPWLWCLSQTADCRIFAKKTVPDIIKKVFTDAGFTDFREELESYPELEYCVQYRETDLAFVSRLMEQYGIYYFFEHTPDKHTLVLADRKGSHKPVACKTVPLMRVVGDARPDCEHLTQWTAERRFRTGKITLTDYDFLKPDGNMTGEDQASERYARSNLEIYDYAAKYPRANPTDKKKTSDGDKFAKVRLQATQALDHRRYAVGDAPSLLPGGWVKLQRHTNGGENQDYLVVRASHLFADQDIRSGGGGGDAGYSGQYELLPLDRPYRAPLATPRPVIHGPQTAKVIGKQGEEIDVDDHGRILVQFHWDRDKKLQDARRVRVAQVWSGKGWGGQVIPRIGQEVVVEFLEGDPDRPLVIGTVYNETNKFPYSPRDLKVRSGIKTDSTKGSGGNKYNELYFHDEKGSEKVYMRAEKDHEVLVRNSESREIGVAFPSPRNSPSRTTTLKKGDDELAIDSGNQKVTICADQTVKIGENKKLDVGINQTEKIGMNLEITAGMKIELTVGASKLTIDNGGITLNAPMIKIEAMGLLTLSGALIKIN